jgi:hypothetical protein
VEWQKLCDLFCHSIEFWNKSYLTK